MNTIIVGNGEIGNSLRLILEEEYPVAIIDGSSDLFFCDNTYEIMHVAFPYSNKFIKEVQRYQKRFKPKYTVIHSTVPVGTSRKLKAIHSPAVGIHPHLEESLKTFAKFLGGEKASEVAQYFRRAGMKVQLTDRPESTELMKICSTSFYGLCIEWNKEVKDMCDKNKVPFELWSLWNSNYNNGYEKLGYPEYRRPILQAIKTKIKGHCVINNLEFLQSKFKELIKRGN